MRLENSPPPPPPHNLSNGTSLITVNSKVNKLITNDETRDDNNNRRVTPTVKCGPNHIKHCQINNSHGVGLNIVFASSNNFHFTSHHSGFENKTKQVRFYLLFNFHLQFTNKSVGSLCPVFITPGRYIRGTQCQFSENICSEDDLRSRILGTCVVKFLACLPLLGFLNS